MQITCSSCGYPLEIRDQDAGHQFFCPQCGRPMPIASPDEAMHVPPIIPDAAGPPATSVSGLAIMSLVLGLLSFGTCPFLLSLLAITFGALALGRIGQDEQRLGGRGLAIAGMSLGVISLVLRPLGCLFWPVLVCF